MTDLNKLVEDLHDIENAMFYLGTSPINMDKVSMYYAYDKGWGQTAKDAAAAIEELQAQLPKRGKWVGVSPMVDTVQCSACGGQLFSAELETPYCPYCGAKMEVQDGQA